MCLRVYGNGRRCNSGSRCSNKIKSLVSHALFICPIAPNAAHLKNGDALPTHLNTHS